MNMNVMCYVTAIIIMFYISDFRLGVWSYLTLVVIHITSLYKILYTIACDENNPCASKSLKIGMQLY